MDKKNGVTRIMVEIEYFIHDRVDEDRCYQEMERTVAVEDDIVYRDIQELGKIYDENSLLSAIYRQYVAYRVTPDSDLSCGAEREELKETLAPIVEELMREQILAAVKAARVDE